MLFALCTLLSVSRRCLAFDPCYGSNAFDCGAVTWFSNVKWYNSPRRTTFVWEHEAAVYDKDGSFTGGEPGSYLIASSATYSKNLCTEDETGRYTGNGSPDPNIPVENWGAMICLGSKNGERFKLGIGNFSVISEKKISNFNFRLKILHFNYYTYQKIDEI